MQTSKPGFEFQSKALHRGPAAWLAVITLLGSFACNVASPDNTGGTDITAGACGRGLVVVNTDYQSTNVSLVAIDGKVLSTSFLSSASTPPGLSAPLGGDVVVPT
ncbi:MAG: hypothetical protein CVU63_07695, partial [Deltaproteobacteria bacterium HGW-Deltaproteobacteria-20]